MRPDLIKSPTVRLKQQIEAFHEQIAIAESLRKPLIIHCVRAYSELLAFRKKSDQSIPWIFHWFNADEQIARELIEKTAYLSFGHMLFKEQSKAYQGISKSATRIAYFSKPMMQVYHREIYAKAAQIRKIQNQI